MIALPKDNNKSKKKSMTTPKENPLKRQGKKDSTWTKFLHLIRDQQGIVALLVAGLIFISNPYIIQMLWPGDMDPGIIIPGSFFAILAFAAVIFFFGIFVAWKAFEFDFWGLDLYYNQVPVYFNALAPLSKICVIFIPFFLLLAFFAFSLLAAIYILS